GSHFRLDHANCAIRPVQKPTPPVWFGANADRAIRRAARMGGCWYINPHSTLATIERQMALYRAALAEHAQPMPTEVPIMREVFVADSRAEAIRRARPALEIKYQAYRAWGQDKVMPKGDDFDRDFDSLIDDRFLFGAPDEVAEQIVALRRRFGATHVVFGAHWPGMSAAESHAQMRLLAGEVLPRVRATA
ncbi:MAG: LLM class flavin-dependent oxidoreductase, partial [Rhodospirillales bacterium]|nr:LLM class flavin-dependent oxidoreductase [Rhodospirillales bacterium]